MRVPLPCERRNWNHGHGRAASRGRGESPRDFVAVAWPKRQETPEVAPSLYCAMQYFCIAAHTFAEMASAPIWLGWMLSLWNQ
jgi:hypothetical protein